LTIGARRGT